MHNRVPSPPAGAVTFKVADVDDVVREEGAGPVTVSPPGAEADVPPETDGVGAAPAEPRTVDPTTRYPSTRRRPTLWEQGSHPGRLVVRAATLFVLLCAGLSVLAGGRIGLFFDLCFVLVCAVIALWVRPRDFFMVGVLPPILLACLVVVLAIVDTGAVAQADDAVAQAVVSGLAHHATPLVLGYGLTLGLIALRQLALRHRGTLRLR